MNISTDFKKKSKKKTEVYRTKCTSAGILFLQTVPDFFMYCFGYSCFLILKRKLRLERAFAYTWSRFAHWTYGNDVPRYRRRLSVSKDCDYTMQQKCVLAQTFLQSRQCRRRALVRGGAVSDVGCVSRLLRVLYHTQSAQSKQIKL